jgi:two-component system, chemotaxis family, sensor kinase CheA
MPMLEKLSPQQRFLATSGFIVGAVLILALGLAAVATPGIWKWLVVGMIALAGGVLAWSLHKLIGDIGIHETAVARSKQEAENILSAVGDGLFLLNKEFEIGEQHSKALLRMFSRDAIAGENFFDIMRNLVPEKVARTAKDYLELLFGERVNERLVQDLNPLDVVELNFDDGQGSFETKFLGFRFKRVFVSGKLSHLLVTVSDISKRVLLEQELRESQERTQAQMDMLVELLHVEPRVLRGFMQRAQESLERVNEALRRQSSSPVEFKDKVHQIFGWVHSIKGESAALGLKSFQAAAHDLETILTDLRSKGTLTGNDFLPFTVKLEELFTQLDSVRILLNRLSQVRSAMGEDDEDDAAGGPRNASSAPAPFVEPLKEFTESLARRNGKQARFVGEGLEPGKVPSNYVRLVNDALVQFVRNSVVHGIETVADRKALGKPERGTLLASFATTATGFELTFRDDGAGINAEKLRATAVKKGRLTQEEATKWDTKQLLTLIFEPDFSTANQVTDDAGRGVGLNLVRDRVQSAKGQIRLGTAANKGTQFKIILPQT